MPEPGAAGRTRPTNRLNGQLAPDAPRDLREQTEARVRQLHDLFATAGHEGATEELATTLRVLGLDHMTEAGHLSRALSTMTSLRHYELDGGRADLPENLRAAFETSYLLIFDDYLGATGDMLTQLLVKATAEPNLVTMTSLEERGRYAASAARGSGKSENEQFAGLADDFAKVHPEAAKNLPAARSALKKVSIEARELHADLAGFDKGSLSRNARVHLVYINAPNADRALLDKRLDAVEAALDRGANRLASAILSAVGDVLPSIGVMEIFGPLTEEKYEKNLTANHAPISLADARAVKARVDELRPRVFAHSLTNRLGELEALQSNGFETPRNIQYGAEDIVKRAADDPIDPALLARAQKLFLTSITDQIEAPYTALREVAPMILAAASFDDETSKAAHAALQLAGPVDQPDSLDFLDETEQAALTAARTAHALLRDEVRTKVRALVDDAFQPIADRLAEILLGPEPQQQAAMHKLYGRAARLDGLLRYLPDTQGMSTLCMDIYRRGHPLT